MFKRSNEIIFRFDFLFVSKNIFTHHNQSILSTTTIKSCRIFGKEKEQRKTQNEIPFAQIQFKIDSNYKRNRVNVNKWLQRQHLCVRALICEIFFCFHSAYAPFDRWQCLWALPMPLNRATPTPSQRRLRYAKWAAEIDLLHELICANYSMCLFLCTLQWPR